MQTWNCGMVISKDLWQICPEGSTNFKSRVTYGELSDRHVSELNAIPSFHWMSTTYGEKLQTLLTLLSQDHQEIFKDVFKKKKAVTWLMLSMAWTSCWVQTNAPRSPHNVCNTWREAWGHLLLLSSSLDRSSSAERLLFPADLLIQILPQVDLYISKNVTFYRAVAKAKSPMWLRQAAEEKQTYGLTWMKLTWKSTREILQGPLQHRVQIGLQLFEISVQTRKKLLRNI